MFSHHIYPVRHLLLQKSTLYPSFLLSSFVLFFFPLRDMSLLYVCCCLASSFFIHMLCSVMLWCLSFLPFYPPPTLSLVLLFLMLLWFLLSLLLSIWTLLLCLYLSILHSFFPLCLKLYLSHYSTLFYMFCRWIRGSFFLFALFHFLCRAVVRSAEVLSPPPRGPVHHAEAVDSCLRPLQHPGPMLLTPL